MKPRDRTIKGATIKDVASLAGVSPKTVSNVINGYVHVTPRTRSRVQQAVEKLGFRPNRAARYMRTGHTGMIGLILPRLDMPYFSEISRSFLSAAEEHGHTLLIEQTFGDRKREAEILCRLADGLVDGVVLSPLAPEVPHLSGHVGTGQCVFLDERPSGLRADYVGIDHAGAAREAVAHLARDGRTRIAAIGLAEPCVGRSLSCRTGYREALAAAGLHVDRRLEKRSAGHCPGEGAAAMRTLLDETDPPDAVFCFDDALAWGALRTLYERGLRVPDDVAVMGVGNAALADYCVPGLSSVAADEAAIARSAVRLLLERIRSPSVAARQIVVEHSLRIRESSRKRD